MLSSNPLLVYLLSVINIHTHHRKLERALFKHFLNTPLCFPQKKECLEKNFFLHKDQSVSSLLFIFTNPENQYATNSLILISYLKGEDTQNKNKTKKQCWHTGLLCPPEAGTTERHWCPWLPRGRLPLSGSPTGDRAQQVYTHRLPAALTHGPC